MRAGACCRADHRTFAYKDRRVPDIFSHITAYSHTEPHISDEYAHGHVCASDEYTGAHCDSEGTKPATPTRTPGLGGRLVFQVASGGDTYTMNADGTNLTRLTHGMDPSWSRDGSQMAFAFSR